MTEEAATDHLTLLDELDELEALARTQPGTDTDRDLAETCGRELVLGLIGLARVAVLTKATQAKKSITCPHCGDQYESSEVEYDGDERDMDCIGCGAVFDITAHVTCTFTCTLRTPGEPQT